VLTALDFSSEATSFKFACNFNLCRYNMARMGWDDHVITVALKARPGGAWGAVPPPVRFAHLTESAARALQSELRAAAAAAAVSDSVFV
jgi:hypothetical protein